MDDPTTDVPHPQHVSRRHVLNAAALLGSGAVMIAVFPGCTAVNEPETPRPPAGAAAKQPEQGNVAVNLNINGQPRVLQIEPRDSLLDTLREKAGLTGSKKGCDHGQCGACTVLVDGRRVLSCLTLAIAAQGRQITTIEGLANREQLHPLQQAFMDHDAFQCGYCTPGQICSGIGLLNEGHAATDDDIREQMAGNICRCGAYPNIVAAIRQTMQRA